MARDVCPQQDWKVEFESAEEGRDRASTRSQRGDPMTPTQADVQKRGLDYFRRVVTLVYREIGVLKPSNHQAIFSKANIPGGFFGQNRKAQARELYKSSLSDNSITQTLERYEERTGLTLEDVHEAFGAGNWRLASGVCAFGGPKWAAIANVAIQL